MNEGIDFFISSANLKNPTLKDAKRLLRVSNPDMKNFSVKWVRKPHNMYSWDGKVMGREGRVKVAADGYRTKVMTISRTGYGMIIK